MNELSLFSGAGGGLLATKHMLGWKTIGYVEWEDYCQRVIAQRIKDGFLDEAPIFGDIEVFISEGYAESYKGLVDVITGGFPCQPFSTASRGKKTAIDRWPYMRYAIEIIQPKFVFAENVNRIPIEKASKDLRAMGYKTKAVTISAKDVGADHIRSRCWLFAYSYNEGELLCRLNAEMGSVPEIQSSFWESSPGDRRIPYGVAGRVDRFKSIGNGQVPIVAATAWKILTGEP